MPRHLITKLKGNKYVNHSFFRPFLYIYDDLMVYKKRRKILWVDEITMPYNHIAQFNMHKGILFSKFEIIMSGGNNVVVMKGVWNRPARKAKTLIDNKVYHAHNKQHQPKHNHIHAMESVERSLNRLKELLIKEKINKKEFEKRKKRLLEEVESY